MRLFDASAVAVGSRGLLFWSQPLGFMSSLFHNLKYALSVGPPKKPARQCPDNGWILLSQYEAVSLSTQFRLSAWGTKDLQLWAGLREQNTLWMDCSNQHVFPALEITLCVNENDVAGRSSVHPCFLGWLLTTTAQWPFPGKGSLRYCHDRSHCWGFRMFNP